MGKETVREFKFRAWFIDKKFKVLEGQKCSEQGERTLLEFLQDVKDCADENGYDFILMQFTGLLDKNGKEICEGDIVKYYVKDEDKYYTNLVSFERGVFTIGDWINYPIGIAQKLWYCKNNIEVIGNIYENPELIK